MQSTLIRLLYCVCYGQSCLMSFVQNCGYAGETLPAHSSVSSQAGILCVEHETGPTKMYLGTYLSVYQTRGTWVGTGPPPGVGWGLSALAGKATARIGEGEGNFRTIRHQLQITSKLQMFLLCWRGAEDVLALEVYRCCSVDPV